MARPVRAQASRRDTRVLLRDRGDPHRPAAAGPAASATSAPSILDEFHERSIHADLGLALARQAWRARDDLRLVVMSATLAGRCRSRPFSTVAQICRARDGCIRSTSTIARATAIPTRCEELLPARRGSILCFLPGAPRSAVRQRTFGRWLTTGTRSCRCTDRCRRTSRIARSAGDRQSPGDPCDQHRRDVADRAGVSTRDRHRPSQGRALRSGSRLDSLELERIPADAAEQRAGRAGRSAPAGCGGCGAPGDRLRPHGDAEIHRVDLSDAVLDILAWGGRSARLRVVRRAGRRSASMPRCALLEQLGAIRDGQADRHRRVAMNRLPLHPRLARMLVESGGSRDVALACALLSERHLTVARHPATTVERSAVGRRRRGALPPHVVTWLAVWLAVRGGPQRSHRRRERERRFLRAIFARLSRIASARRRSPGSPNSSSPPVMARCSAARAASATRSSSSPSTCRPRADGGDLSEADRSGWPAPWMREWLEPGPTVRGLVHRFVHDSTRRRDASARSSANLYGEIAIGERPAAIDPEVASTLARGCVPGIPVGPEADAQLLLRLTVRRARRRPCRAGQTCRGRQDAHCRRYRSSDALDWSSSGIWTALRRTRSVYQADGRATLQYQEDGSVVAAVKLQELFGLADTPRVGPRQTPVVLSLLAPNGRPVQTTTRPAQLLEHHLSRSPPGTAGPLSEASVAGRSLDRITDGPHEAPL